LHELSDKYFIRFGLERDIQRVSGRTE